MGAFVTNDDGRLNGPALKAADFAPGVYEWVFDVGPYFAGVAGVPTAGTPFLDEVPLRFGIDDPEAQCVPIDSSSLAPPLCQCACLRPGSGERGSGGLRPPARLLFVHSPRARTRLS